MLNFSVQELSRLMDYIPETAPDLYQKLLGQTVALRYYEFLKDKHFKASEEELEAWMGNLTEAQLTAWNIHDRSHRLDIIE